MTGYSIRNDKQTSPFTPLRAHNSNITDSFHIYKVRFYKIIEILHPYQPMLKDKTVAVVVPAYNEEKQILHVIESMPDFVDRIIIVDDKSSDRTFEIVK